MIESSDDQDHNKEYTVLSKLYVLAEFLHDVVTKDVVLEAISAKSKEVSQDGTQRFPDFASICIVYGGTTRDSPARSLLVQLYTDNNLAPPDGTSDNVPKDFAFDLAISLLANRPLRKTYEACKERLKQNASEAEQKIKQLESENSTLRVRQYQLRGELDAEIKKASDLNEELTECKGFVEKKWRVTWQKGMKPSYY